MQAQGGEIAQRMLIVQIQILAAAAAACRLQRSGERRAGGTRPGRNKASVPQTI
jgi:hypothetical protein